MRFRPCIDLHENKVKQIVGSTLSRDGGAVGSTNFVSAHGADYYAEMYRRDGLTGGHVIMLGPGSEEAAAAALRAWPGNLQLGGGVNAENAGKYLDMGASAVIVTSWIFENGALSERRLDKLLAAAGRERLVLDLSCRKKADGRYYIVTDRWQTFTDTELAGPVFEFLSAYAFEFLIHAVDVEGKKCGVDAALLEILACQSPLPCVYAGGAGSFDDVRTIRDAGRGKVDFTIGSALDIFGGTMKYDELLEFVRKM